MALLCSTQPDLFAIEIFNGRVVALDEGAIHEANSKSRLIDTATAQNYHLEFSHLCSASIVITSTVGSDKPILFIKVEVIKSFENCEVFIKYYYLHIQVPGSRT